MTVHLVKLAVGVEDIEHLREIQARRIAEAAKRGDLTHGNRHITRSTPKQAAEIIGEGSLYWVIKRAIRVRQRIIDIQPTVNSEGKPACALVLDHELVPTRLKPCKAFQGWRYLKPEMMPEDAVGGGNGEEAMPSEMLDELRELGLL